MSKYDQYISYLEMLDSSTVAGQLKTFQDSFESEARSLPSYTTATLNGVAAEFLIEKDSSAGIAKFTAFPGHNVYAGDIIYALGGYWLVYSVLAPNLVQSSGILWLCNQKLRFQNGDSTIIERWGVVSSGSYTSPTGSTAIKTVDGKYNAYFPFDDDTKKLFVDKRVALRSVYNNEGTQILEVYTIRHIDAIGENYNSGDHLMVLGIESTEYSAEKDNLTEYICDYILTVIPEESPVEDETLLSCAITGRSSIRVGTTKKYTASFYTSDGVTLDETVSAVWFVSTLAGVTHSVTEGVLSLTVALEESLVGSSIEITLSDADGLYAPSVTVVEVVPIG